MATHQTPIEFRVFLASPGEVGEERAFVRELLESILPNDAWASHPVKFTLISWDHPHGGTPMLAHLTPQQAVSRYSGEPANCDIVIVVLWSRLGTHLDLAAHPRPGGGRWESGTEWEYENAFNADPRLDILVYHRTEPAPVDPDGPDPDEDLRQRRLVRSFLARFRNPDRSFRGGASGYPTVEAFKARVTQDLKRVVKDRLTSAAQTVPAQPVSALPHDPAPTIPVPPLCLGRDPDLSRIVTALNAGPTAILVQGPGGIGKTTLTQQAANDPAVVGRFGHCRWFAELETALDGDTFDAQLLLALGLEPTQGFQAALQRLGQAPGLLVLDNLETAWDRAGPPIESRLAALAAVPGLALLASVRGERAVGGVRWQRHRLTPLTDPDARALFREIADMIPDSDPMLPALLRELGGVPLAICLTARQAAGQTELSGLWTAWHQLGTNMAVWDGAEEGRLTSVPHSIALSLNAPNLGPDGKRLFAILGQCPAGLAPADRDALLGPAAFAADRDLRAVGLLHANASRLDLLPPVRDYARRVCPPAGEDRASWCQHFLALVRERGERVGQIGGAEAVVRLLPDVANIAAALSAAPDLSLREVAVEAVVGTSRLLQATGAGSVAGLRALALACHAASDPRGEAECLHWAGDIALRRSDHAGARALYEQARPLYQQVGSVLGEANCIRGLGDIALERSDHAGAGALYEQARPLYQQVGDVLGEANCIKSLGDIALRRSDHAGAGALYEQARPLYQQVGDVLGEANCLQRLGDIALSRSDHAGAGALYEQARPLYQQVGSVRGEGGCALGLGRVARGLHDEATARARGTEALVLFERVHATRNIAIAHEDLAHVTTSNERDAHVQAAKAAWREMDLPDQIARVEQTLP